MAPTITPSRATLNADYSIPKNHWAAHFFNLSSETVDRYDLYETLRPSAVYDLGDRGRKGPIAAELQVNFGLGAPPGIQSDHFAMEAFTRIWLRQGYFYWLSSTSDDGVRFVFRDSKTDEVLTELAGDWRDRSVQSPMWSQILLSSVNGRCHIYVQYYERTEAGALNIKLERVKLSAKVVASNLNVRSKPSTRASIIETLPYGTPIVLLRCLRSTDDPVYPHWYRVITPSKNRGYVVMDRQFVERIGHAVNLATIGDGSQWPDLQEQAVISTKAELRSDQKIPLRRNKDIAADLIGQLGVGTPLIVLGKEMGGRYLNGFDAWYKVQVKVQEMIQTGYVAAYYVDTRHQDGRFDTAISKANLLYQFHLKEVLTPAYYFQSYRPFIKTAIAPYSWLTESVVAGIGSRESVWGRVLSPPGPAGTGDGGHGHGLMQIDDRYHQTFIHSGQWSDPKSNIDYAIESVLVPNYNSLKQHTHLRGFNLLRGAIASYNAGLNSVLKALEQGQDLDYYTTGQDYSWDVLNRAGWYQLHGFK